MMQKLLGKIFRSGRSQSQFLTAGLGFMVGLLMLLLSVQLYFSIQSLLDPREAYSEYLVISKKITAGNTLSFGRVEFSPEEIKKLEKQEFVDFATPFISNQYEVLAYSKGNLPFMTELFFESVPDSVIDNTSPLWTWQEDSDFLPVILSQDMLNLYNFGYALSKGLPQISRSTAALLTMKVRVRGPKGERTFDAKIVGFSERIPSVLVPQEFMNWANTNIGAGEQPNPSRLIIKTENPSDPKLGKYFEENKLEISQDRLQASKAGALIKTVMSIIGIIGVFFISLAFVIFSSNFRVILAEAQNELRLLLQLGYTTSMLQKFIFSYFLLFMVIIVLLSGAVLYYAVNQIQFFLQESGLNVEMGLDYRVTLIGFIFIGLSLLLNAWTLNRLLKKYT